MDKFIVKMRNPYKICQLNEAACFYEFRYFVPNIGFFIGFKKVVKENSS